MPHRLYNMQLVATAQAVTECIMGMAVYLRSLIWAPTESAYATSIILINSNFAGQRCGGLMVEHH